MARPLNEAGSSRIGEQSDATKRKPEQAALAAGGLAALLAGACCLGPLVLVGIGVGGTWLANFQLLEPYRPILLGVAAVSLAFAWKRIYRPAPVCEPGQVCAVPRVKRGYKLGFWAVAALLGFMLVYPYFAPLFY